MRKDKHIAFKLRRQGKSFNQIALALGVPKSTLSAWFKGDEFSRRLKEKLGNQTIKQSSIRLAHFNIARGLANEHRYELARKEAIVEMEQNLVSPLFVAAVAAYWGEGDKRSKNHVRITNTDPIMLALFRRFLIEQCGVQDDRIRGAIFLYDDLNEAECKEFWMRQTGITRFHKTMFLPSGRSAKKLSHGICTLIVSDTRLKQKMLVWIDLLPKMVLN